MRNITCIIADETNFKNYLAKERKKKKCTDCTTIVFMCIIRVVCEPVNLVDIFYPINFVYLFENRPKLSF